MRFRVNEKACERPFPGKEFDKHSDANLMWGTGMQPRRKVNFLRNIKMTEFEIATLAVQNSMLAFQKSTLAFQKSGLELQKSALVLQESALMAQYAGVWVAGAVGFAQCALIGAGFWFIRREMNARDKALEILMKRAENNGLTLRTLIARTAR